MAVPNYRGKQRGEISFDGQYQWTGYDWSPVSNFGSGGIMGDSSRATSQSLPSSTTNTGAFQTSDPNRVDYGQDARNTVVTNINQRNQVIGINNDRLEDYIDIDFSDFDPVEISFATIPIHFTFSLTFGSDPNIDFSVNNSGKSKTIWSSSEFTQTKTFKAKAGGYGPATNNFQISTQTNPDKTNPKGGNVYEVVIRNNGGIVKTIRQGAQGAAATYKGVYKFK
jgi:hypothetical protein